MSPLISIIMPVYNNERYFPIAVQSVLDQSFTDFELIIISERSTDDTSKIADEFAMKDGRVRVIHLENQWIYASLNSGVAIAGGEYVYFLNSDDSLKPDALKIISDIAVKYSPDVVWTCLEVHECDEHQTITKSNVFTSGVNDCFYSGVNEVRENYIYFYKSQLSHNQLNLYQASIAKKHKFRNDIYGADQFFNISIASDLNSAYICSTPVYNFFIYEGNQMNASVGKYYGYEHEMYNDLYMEYARLFRSWNTWNDDIEDVLSASRLTYLTGECRSFFAQNCSLSTEEKLRGIFGAVDDLVYNCAVKTNRLEELESRILSVCNEFFSRETIDSSSAYYFVYELLESLLRYEKTNEDMQKIKSGVYHKNNPFHLGKCFYEKLIKGTDIQEV